MPSHIQHELQVPTGFALRRLDQAVAELLPQYSRSRIQQWIREGGLTVNGREARPRDRLTGGETLLVSVDIFEGEDLPEDIPLELVHEDEALLVVYKPAGLVVHPGAGNPGGTLLNALLNHEPSLGQLPRAGIVHRLDKDTSGLMVVARTLEAQNYLVGEIQERHVTRIYDAVVYGNVAHLEGTVDAAIARHPVKRKQMALRIDGKPSVTHYRVVTQFEAHALLECRLETGRTHQIRVHMQSIGHPLVGDPVYGGHYRRAKSGGDLLEAALRNFNRQTLHARKLSLIHPITGKRVSWQVQPPEDFVGLVEALDESSY